MTSLADRNVVVTGASGALGGAVVSRLSEAFANLYLPIFEKDTPEHLLRISDAHVVNGVDLGDEEQVVAYFQTLPEIWASIHLTGGFAMASIQQTTLKEVNRQFMLNAASCFLCCREAVAKMASGGGRIVNVAAKPVLQPVGGMSAYAMSKGAVASLTRALAEELREDGILVNAIVPSIIDTPGNRAAMPQADFDAWPKPEQLAEVIAMLIAPDFELTTGELLPVYGRS